MRMLFDFRCSEGHTAEHFTTKDTSEVSCLICGKPANRIISPVRSVLDPISGDFLGATRKWAKHREQQIKKERKEEYQ